MIGSGGAGSGQAGARRGAAGRWQVTVSLGAAGECFAGSLSGAGSYSSSGACQPIGLPPATAVLRPLLFSAGRAWPDTPAWSARGPPP